LHEMRYAVMCVRLTAPHMSWWWWWLWWWCNSKHSRNRAVHHLVRC